MNSFHPHDQQPSPAPSPISAPLSSFSHRRARRSPAFEAKLEQMEVRLAPLVQLTTGLVHRRFPATLLCFWLLTDDELEALADFYHQRTPCVYTAHYPCPVAWDSAGALEDKRRRIGRFIGLRGCESPVVFKTEEEIFEEAARARWAEEASEEALRRKYGWYS